MPYRPGMNGLAGVLKQGRCRSGSLRNLGGLVASISEKPVGITENNSRPMN